MKTYLVTFVFDDSSTTKNIVKASSEERAVNTVLNNTPTSKQPKFVIIEEANLVESDEDLNLVSNFKKSCDNLYTFDNKLSETIEIGGITLCLGSVINFKEFISHDKGETR